jgi:hypothetical protein
VHRQQEVDAAVAVVGQLAGNIVLGVGDQPVGNVVKGVPPPAALAAPQ